MKTPTKAKKTKATKTKISPLLRPTPWGPNGNPALWKLRFCIDEDRFISLMKDMDGLIDSAQTRYERALKSGEPDYAEFVGEEEADYVEELVGAAFVALQTKVLRVSVAAVRLKSAVEERTGESMSALVDGNAVRAIGGPFKDDGLSLAQLVWHGSNFYKHRDDWHPQAWFPELDDKDDDKDHKRRIADARRTISKLRTAGVTHGSTGNMRTMLRYLSGSKQGQCLSVAVGVQDWAKNVGALAREELGAIATRRPTE